MIGLHRAAVGLDDGAADVQAQAQAVALGGEEGREHLLQLVAAVCAVPVSTRSIPTSQKIP